MFVCTCIYLYITVQFYWQASCQIPYHCEERYLMYELARENSTVLLVYQIKDSKHEKKCFILVIYRTSFSANSERLYAPQCPDITENHKKVCCKISVFIIHVQFLGFQWQIGSTQNKREGGTDNFALMAHRCTELLNGYQRIFVNVHVLINIYFFMAAEIIYNILKERWANYSQKEHAIAVHVQL